MTGVEQMELISRKATERVGFALSKEELERADLLAKEMGISRSKLIRLALLRISIDSENKKA